MYSTPPGSMSYSVNAQFVEVNKLFCNLSRAGKKNCIIAWGGQTQKKMTAIQTTP